MMGLCKSILILLGVCWAFLVVYVIIFQKIWEVFNHYFFEYFFFLLSWHSHYTYVAPLFFFEPLFIFIFSIFWCRISINLTSSLLIISFASLNILLSPFGKFLFQSLNFSTLEFKFSFMISMYLLIFSTWCNIVILPSFTSSIILSFTSVNMHLITTLQSFAVKCDTSCSYRQFLSHAFLPSYGSYFPISWPVSYFVIRKSTF